MSALLGSQVKRTQFTFVDKMRTDTLIKYKQKVLTHRSSLRKLLRHIDYVLRKRADESM